MSADDLYRLANNEAEQWEYCDEPEHHHPQDHPSAELVGSTGTTMHRVNTTGHLLLDDFSATPLSPSARERLVKRFSLRKKSTEEHHSVTAAAGGDAAAVVGFYGAYGSLRKTLDYTYHVHYRKERQWLHDAIIEDCLLEHQHDDWSHQEMSTVLPRTPWLILMAGAHGAGKHHVVRELMNTDRLPLLSFVCVDTDDLRRYLPEYSTYLATSPDQVDQLTRHEAGYLSETLTMAALQAGRNVLFHSCLNDWHWYQQAFLPDLRRQCHGVRVALLHVTADPDVVVERARLRGRTRASELERTLLETVPHACERLQTDVDYFAKIRNNGAALEILEGSTGNDWESFAATFDQRGSILSLSCSTPSPMVVGPQRRLSSLKRRFSAAQSSEENHASDDMEFYGPFAEIRRSLDYSYHRNYTFERQVFQDAIVREFLEAAVVHGENGEVCTTPTQPWAVFTAGAMGAGKGYTIARLVEKGRFPLLAFVRVNPDAIRRYLPEYHLYIETNPDMAGALTNKEAGYISEVLTLAGLQRGKNVLVDGSLRHAEWYRNYFAQLRREFPMVRLAIIHVVAPREAIFKRATVRMKKRCLSMLACMLLLSQVTDHSLPHAIFPMTANIRNARCKPEESYPVICSPKRSKRYLAVCANWHRWLTIMWS